LQGRAARQRTVVLGFHHKLLAAHELECLLQGPRGPAQLRARGAARRDVLRGAAGAVCNRGTVTSSG